MIAVYLLYFICVFVAFYNFLWKRKGLPPGPIPLPILGNRLTVKKHLPGYDAFLGWAKRYGPVYTYWYGEHPIVVVTDYRIIKDTFIRHGDAYAGRDLLNEIYLSGSVKGIDGIYGLLKTEGYQWSTLRRFTIQVLRNLGMGKSTIEGRILHEMRMITDRVAASIDDGEPIIDLIPLTDLAVGNVMNLLTFGCSFRGEAEKEFKELKQMVHGHLNCLSQVTTQMVLTKPVLRNLPLFAEAFANFEFRVKRLHSYYRRQIEQTIERQRSERKNAADSDEKESTYFVDAFLRQMEKVKGTGDEKYFNLQNLSGICQDLFVAGQDTLSNTVAWLILYMVLYPDVQRKMQEELDSVVGPPDGPEQTIGGAEKRRLPYTNAVIFETQRYCNLIPQNLIHRTTRDVEILGHKIAKGTRIVPQISCVMYDERIFPEPLTFNPNRFIDDNGQLSRAEELIPYSIGKRQCPGETLAVIELFLITANFFHKFKVSAPDPKNPPSTKKTPGVTVMPQPFSCYVEKRF